MAHAFPHESDVYSYTWYWRVRLPERKNQRCAVLARGKLNSILVQFEDGFLVITSRYAVRKAPSTRTASRIHSREVL